VRTARNFYKGPARSLRVQNEHRNRPVGLLLVLGVVGEGRDGPLPPLGPLVAVDLTRGVVLRRGAVLQRDLRVRLDVAALTPPLAAPLEFWPRSNTRTSHSA
jgi:hypothetical protein